MKIRRDNELAPTRMTIDEFAERHDLTMVVERSVAKFGRTTAHFEGAEIRNGSILASAYGVGRNEEKAIRDYAIRISGELLVIDAAGPNRREIEVPQLVG